VDRREAVVAAADTVPASVLEVLEERGDQRRVELGDVQLAGQLAGLFGGELQQQAERLAVRGDRVRARTTLRDEPVCEVGLGRPCFLPVEGFARIALSAWIVLYAPAMTATLLRAPSTTMTVRSTNAASLLSR